MKFPLYKLPSTSMAGCFLANKVNALKKWHKSSGATVLQNHGLGMTIEEIIFGLRKLVKDAELPLHLPVTYYFTHPSHPSRNYIQACTPGISMNEVQGC